jgi:hypothetical protein
MFKKAKNINDTITIIKKRIIPSYKLYDVELTKDNLPAKMFLFWINKFYMELIPGWNASVYFTYAYDDPDPEHKKNIRYECIDKWTSAITEFFDSDRVVNFAFNLSRDYSYIDNNEDLFFEIGQTAFHEVMHVVLGDLDKTSKNKSKNTQTVKEVHAVIVNLENNVFPYIFESCRDEINRLIK